MLTVVPLLVFSLLMALLHAPRMFATAYDSLGVQYDKVSAALSDGAALTVAAGSLQLLLLGAVRWSAGRPGRRAAVILAFTAAFPLATFTWWPNGAYRPIQPGERGTIEGGLHSVAAIPSPRPALTPDGEQELGARVQRSKLVGRARERVEQRKPRGERTRQRSRATATPTATPQASATPGATATPATATPTPTPTATPVATATPAVDVGAGVDVDP